MWHRLVEVFKDGIKRTVYVSYGSDDLCRDYALNEVSVEKLHRMVVSLIIIKY